MKQLADLNPLQRAIVLSIKDDPKPGIHRSYGEFFRSIVGLVVWVVLVFVILLFATACERKIVLVLPEKPELETEVTDPPEGWTLEYNEKTNEYRWCFPSGYCPTLSHRTRMAAVVAAWKQYEYELKYSKEHWRKVK
jgi:hypothetical protein